MKLARLAPLSIFALLAACAHTPPPELVDARAAYDRASNGLASQLAPADLHVAATQLSVAENAWRERGDDYRVRDLAYAAERKARLAEIRAHTRAASKQQEDARAELDQLRDEKVRTTSAQLNVAQQQLAEAEQQRAAAEHRTMTAEQQRDLAERQRAEAEKRAQQAQSDLSRIASVKQEPRGMVITLSGSVLFVSGKYDLLPEAMAKLSEVANVLTRQDPDSKIVVQGYTDSQGSETFNLELSRQRAEAVRSYLVSHGIAPDRISAEGFGPARPIANNASPEGRANNRRVEIVVEKK